MSLPQKIIYYSPEHYLELERDAVERHEYIDGFIYAMAGESLAHSRININLAGEIRAQLKWKPGEALSPNMKVRTQTASLFAYPDLTIFCGEPVFHDRKRDVLLNPKVIFEILSPATENYDRGEKFERYRAELPTLTDYVLISQKKPLIEHFARQPDGSWLMREARGLDATLFLPNVDCALRLTEIYDRVEFPPETFDPASGFFEETENREDETI
jgi:Uma2 family endonuclease